MELSGIAASAGIGIGKICIIKDACLDYDSSLATDIEAEKDRLSKAIEAFTEKTTAKAKELRDCIGPKEAEILEDHLILISDPSMSGRMFETVEAGSRAEAAVDAVTSVFIDMFSGMEDDLMRQRASDIRDIRDVLLGILLGVADPDLGSIAPGTILVARDLTPSMTSRIKKENIAGIITEAGSSTSHLAIIARAMGIPLVSSVTSAVSSVTEGETAIVDGNAGIALINPSEASLTKYRELMKKEADAGKELENFRGKKTVTADGSAVMLLCNIGTPEDSTFVTDGDGEGVGLFRTEFLFMDKNSDPSEEEQFEAYKKCALALKDKPIIIRTLDIGGDKDIPYLDMKKESNPFLGYRAIRYCLGNRDRYKKQLKAIIRASAYGNLKLMIPLVTCAEEVRAVREMVLDIQKEFDEAGIKYDKNMQTGCMIETPSAALIADILAAESDFFSIGTNDLTQYTMCADRGNPEVSYLNSYLNPSVLRSIRRIIECGKNAGIPVGMCGEAASDPLMIPLLIAFGLDEFSVSPSLVLRTRSLISKWSRSEASALADKVMKLTTRDEIVALLEEYAK